jgi:hypothetical protein
VPAGSAGLLRLKTAMNEASFADDQTLAPASSLLIQGEKFEAVYDLVSPDTRNEEAEKHIGRSTWSVALRSKRVIIITGYPPSQLHRI